MDRPAEVCETAQFARLPCLPFQQGDIEDITLSPTGDVTKTCQVTDVVGGFDFDGVSDEAFTVQDDDINNLHAISIGASSGVNLPNGNDSTLKQSGSGSSSNLSVPLADSFGIDDEEDESGPSREESHGSGFLDQDSNSILSGVSNGKHGKLVNVELSEPSLIQTLTD